MQIGDITTTYVLELVHIDLFGLNQTETVGGKKCALICVDDYSRYIWIDFLVNKSDTFGAFRKSMV